MQRRGGAVTAGIARNLAARNLAARLPALLGLAALALGGLAASPPASAVEWFAGGSVSAGVEAETNRDLDPDDAGSIYGATTAFGLDLTALTPTTQWTFETGASFGAFGGSGDTEGLDGAFPNFAAAVAHNGQHVDTGASFAIDYQPVAFAQIDDTGITEGDATQLTMNLAGDAAYALDARNSLSLGAFSRIIRFPSGTTRLEPTTSYGASLSWGRALTPATQGNVTFGVSRFISESDGDGDGVIIIDDEDGLIIFDDDEFSLDDEDSLSFDLSAGLGHAVNSRLSFSASLGVRATRSTESGLEESGLEESEFTVGPSAGLDIAWRPAADTQLVFALSHGLEPTSFGDLRTTTAIGAGLQHAFNDWTSAGIDVLLQRQSDSSDVRQDDLEEEDPRLYGVISPSIAFTLTEDWALRAGYVFRVQREDGEDAFSNGVFMTLTRQFDILP
jgi:hypothetical protein